MTARWVRESRADSHLTAAVGLGIVAALVAGLGIGWQTAPPQVVEVRTTVTHAAPPVCVSAVRAGRIQMDFAKERDIQDGYARDAALAMVKAEDEGNADEADTQHALANAAALLRDVANLDAIGAEQSFQANAIACIESTEPVRDTERVPS